MLNQLSNHTIIPKPQRPWSSTGVNVYKKVYEKSDAELKTHIEEVSVKFYGQPSKPLQTDTVLNLVNGRNTFLLAGTGFGKSRIAKLYYKMIPKSNRAVVLVLNPLDSLGDNQVYEKEQAGFTAINLTKLNFNEKVAEEISNGVYQFVYMSPETFLNNKIWDSVYFSKTFQDCLALIVVDEAHMIYIWGLVASGQGKKAAAILLWFQDIAIKKSLKLNDESVDIFQGELTQPEIQIVRITMEKSLASSLDLIKVFPLSKDVANKDLVPTLVYSGSRNRTLTVMDVIDRACETPNASLDPHNTCVRRYHSCTGDLDKARCAEEFANQAFPIISATMALGLGQNWKRIRMVAHMGQGDPAQIAQMIGRGAEQTDKDWIDALAITPCCLRIAFSLDNLLGYVPLWLDNPSYIREKEREITQHFDPCDCSNCSVAESAKLVKNLVLANQANFNEIMDNKFNPPCVPDISHKYLLTSE
ncbi:hypothetical protein PTTG_28353 [Puccinia triticina 1-1 BBBD Race 1]|uniref:DNA 3'-5' helicase n=1 Tax=Puccinia triticina (isolate 1-1 / race 1 (BBBD)) TaxID=630390 RepID=A0A180GDC8_PUCT1|nr:hypothetical protein PTTG_28353 [Puccinia triticina 1-1 BBBD Race 1]